MCWCCFRRGQFFHFLGPFSSALVIFFISPLPFSIPPEAPLPLYSFTMTKVRHFFPFSSATLFSTFPFTIIFLWVAQLLPFKRSPSLPPSIAFPPFFVQWRSIWPSGAFFFSPDEWIKLNFKSPGTYLHLILHSFPRLANSQFLFFPSPPTSFPPISPWPLKLGISLYNFKLSPLPQISPPPFWLFLKSCRFF